MKLTTDYAIRTVVFLANCKDTVTVKDISMNTGISTHYLMKVLEPLKKIKIVKSMTGSKGGFLLGLPPEKLTLWRIIRAMEGPCYCMDCMEHEYCSNYVNPHKCILRTYFDEFQKMKIEYFSGVTVAELQKGRNQKHHRIKVAVVGDSETW